MASQFQPYEPGATAPTDPDDAPSCTIWYIQLKLGRRDYSVARMCVYVDALIAQHGFPQPFPRVSRGKLTTTVSAKSRWPRFAVDQWLADWLPPDAAAAAEAAARNRAAAEMDGRACHLQLVKGGKRG